MPTVRTKTLACLAVLLATDYLATHYAPLSRGDVGEMMDRMVQSCPAPVRHVLGPVVVDVADPKHRGDPGLVAAEPFSALKKYLGDAFEDVQQVVRQRLEAMAARRRRNRTRSGGAGAFGDGEHNRQRGPARSGTGGRGDADIGEGGGGDSFVAFVRRDFSTWNISALPESIRRCCVPSMLLSDLEADADAAESKQNSSSGEDAGPPATMDSGIALAPGDGDLAAGAADLEAVLSPDHDKTSGSSVMQAEETKADLRPAGVGSSVQRQAFSSSSLSSPLRDIVRGVSKVLRVAVVGVVLTAMVVLESMLYFMP